MPIVGTLNRETMLNYSRIFYQFQIKDIIKFKIYEWPN